MTGPDSVASQSASKQSTAFHQENPHKYPHTPVVGESSLSSPFSSPLFSSLHPFSPFSRPPLLFSSFTYFLFPVPLSSSICLLTGLFLPPPLHMSFPVLLLPGYHFSLSLSSYLNPTPLILLCYRLHIHTWQKCAHMPPSPHLTFPSCSDRFATLGAVELSFSKASASNWAL